MIDKSARHLRSRTSLIALPILALLLATVGCSSKPEETPKPVVEVQAAKAVRTDLVEHIENDAVLAPLSQAAIVPKVSAPVAKFYVQRGGRVRAGMLLATLENKDLAAMVTDNRGSYEQAEATYVTATRAQVPEELQKSKLDVEQAKANLDVQQKIFDARQILFTQGAIPGRDLDQARVNLVQARAQYEQANKHLEALQGYTHEAAIKSASGALESAKGKLSGAQANLSYTEIRSPINGVVTDRPVFPGEMASATAPLITVMDTSAVLAKAHLPQRQVQQLKIGAPGDATVPGGEKLYPGTISLINPALDPGSTTVEVWLRVDNKAGELKPGTPVRVSLAGQKVPQAIAVPAVAVLTADDGKTTVMVVGADNIAHKREVKLGIKDGDMQQIVSGLDAGETVVTNGAYAMDDGTTVKIVAAGEGESGGDKPSAASGAKE
jgi:multidrug efflux pump subunit AcrA (membrane-fusion protein)